RGAPHLARDDDTAPGLDGDRVRDILLVSGSGQIAAPELAPVGAVELHDEHVGARRRLDGTGRDDVPGRVHRDRFGEVVRVRVGTAVGRTPQLRAGRGGV